MGPCSSFLFFLQFSLAWRFLSMRCTPTFYCPKRRYAEAVRAGSATPESKTQTQKASESRPIPTTTAGAHAIKTYPQDARPKHQKPRPRCTAAQVLQNIGHRDATGPARRTLQLTGSLGNRYDFFFGYFDKTNFAPDGTRVLVSRTRVSARIDNAEASGWYQGCRDNRKPFPVLEIGFIDFCEQRDTVGFPFHKIGETTAWNVHQGAQAQWVGEDIIFNTRTGNSDFFQARVAALSGKVLKEYAAPIYSLSHDGALAAVLNYTHLNICSQYGYASENLGNFCSTAAHLIAEDSSQFLAVLDLASGQVSKLISVSDVAAFLVGEGVLRRHKRSWYRYINHAQWSRDSTELIFLYREQHGKTLDDRFTYGVTINIHTKKMHLVSKSGKDGCVSHHDYGYSNTLLCVNNRYWEYKEHKLHTVHADPLTRVNGHPTFSNFDVPGPGRFILSDTYPKPFLGARAGTTEDGPLSRAISRKQRMQHLYIFDRRASQARLIAWLPAGYSDLHPRWDRVGSLVTVDSGNDRRRHLYSVFVEDILSDFRAGKVSTNRNQSYSLDNNGGLSLSMPSRLAQ
ncbi:unnamed protein product [Amoebophrya sp. A25]|nr:unnamed protein product [Amoebophrya sp. A25]|eukprot:GSA25T00023405001.1